jgi:CRP/FNR family cyclic AMP-dependent transcriptional regulator
MGAGNLHGPDEVQARRMSAEPGSFIARLKPEEVADLMRCGRRRRWRRGSVLLNQGESSRWVAVLLSGIVKVSSLTDEGKEIVLDIRGPGALIGELEAADGKPRPATVIALGSVEALVISHQDFAAFLSSHCGAVWLVVDTLCERLRNAERKRIDFGCHNIARRLAMQLVELAEQYGQPVERGVHITLPLTQDDLASWIGASREAVSKALRSLRLKGWIETGRRSVLILDLPALHNRAL